MRPRSDVAQALLQAALKLSAAGRGATLNELAEHAQVGKGAARMLVPSLKRRGRLQIVGTRRVSYRNRPVAEYAPGVAADDLIDVRPSPGLELQRCMAALTQNEIKS